MRTVNSLIGSPIERLEDLRFLRGRGEYVDDLARSDMLHAAILRSSVAHGRIRSIDVSRARALPGVHSVITATDMGNRVPRVPMRMVNESLVHRVLQGPRAISLLVIARDVVRPARRGVALRRQSWRCAPR